ncbi:MAG: hypothetical protein Q7V88_06260 [Actinomycetota bacterium]|nr:hypothetical protein [Actinomycetota bacterium]
MSAPNGISMNGTHAHGLRVNGTAGHSVLLNGSHGADRDDADRDGDGGGLGARGASDAAATLRWTDDASAGVERERARLEHEIAAARMRAAVAERNAATRDAEVREALRAQLDESRAALARMEAEFQATIAQVKADADAEVKRILEGARQRVAENRRQPLDGRAAEAPDAQ